MFLQEKNLNIFSFHLQKNDLNISIIKVPTHSFKNRGVYF